MEYTLTIELAFGIIAATAVIAGWVKNSSDSKREMIERMARLETKMDTLAATVEKHNNVVERTFQVESNVKTIFRHIDSINERIKEECGE